MNREKGWLRCLLGFLILSFCIALVVNFSFISSTAAASPQYGGTFGTHTSEPRSLDPHVEVIENVYMVTGNIYNGLLRLNQDMTGVECDLAESWKRVDNVTYIFKLRKNVHFHNIPPANGREVTSSDVKYSIERLAGQHGKKVDFVHRYYYEDKLASIDLPDDYTIVFKTKKPYAPFINYIASTRSVIVPKEAVEEYKDLRRNAIGTGPFILEEIVRGSHIILSKNPNYFKKGLPYLDKIHIQIMGDPTSIVASFLAGKLDSIGSQFFQIKLLKEKAPDTIIVEQKGTHMWVLRCPSEIKDEKPLELPFNNLKVRQAIAMSIDKERLLKLALGGAGTVQIGPIPNWPPYSLSEKDQVEYNPEKAKRLLAEAGYPDGFTTELTTWNADYMIRPAQVIQAMLKEVGINVDLKIMEMAQYFGLGKTFGYNMSFHVTSAGVDPDEYITPYFGSPEQAQYFRWIRPDVWKMCSEEAEELNIEKRINLIQKIQKEVISDGRWVCLYTQTRYAAMKPYVHRTFYKNEYQPLMGETVWMEKH